jgi:hypothetical protein
LSSGFVTELTFAFPDLGMHVSCPTHRTVLDFITLMIHVAEFVANIFLPISVTPAIYSYPRMKARDRWLIKSLLLLPPIIWLQHGDLTF